MISTAAITLTTGAWSGRNRYPATDIAVAGYGRAWARGSARKGHGLDHGLGDVAEARKEAEPERKAEVYRDLGLKLTYHPGKRKVRAKAHLDPHRLTKNLQPQHIMKRFVSEG